MEFFDSHCHFNDEKFDSDREQIIKKIYSEGITKMTCIGYNIESSKWAVEISNNYDFMYSTVGISPNDIDGLDISYIDEIRKIAENNKIVAIGEIGLDYYWNKENKEKQKEIFSKQIDIANRLNLPIVIHSRDAWQDTILILKSNPVNKKGVFHCCQLNQELIKEAVKLGFYISFSGNITFKNAKSEGCVNLVPDDKILIETDSPYLSPEPLRGQINTSENVKLVAKKIAEIKNTDIAIIASKTKENAMRIFEIKL